MPRSAASATADEGRVPNVSAGFLFPRSSPLRCYLVEWRSHELDLVLSSCHREGVRLLRGRRRRRLRQLGPLCRPTQGPDEALEVATHGDHEPAALTGLHEVGVRHSLGGEQSLAPTDTELLLANLEPKLALEYVEDLILSPVHVERCRVALR